MTIVIGDNDPRISYSVSEGSTQTSFVVPFEFFDDADLNVYVDGALKSTPSNYTVTGGDGSSDQITLTESGRHLFEFLSPDGGTTILMHQLGQNYI